MTVNPNADRGPWCVVCGDEMSRPNHRFQFRVTEENSLESHRYHGGLLKPGFSPVCGEFCLTKAISAWASPPRQASRPADLCVLDAEEANAALRPQPVAA